MKSRHGKITRKLYQHYVLVKWGSFERYYQVVLPKIDIYGACDIARKEAQRSPVENPDQSQQIISLVTSVKEELRYMDYETFRKSSVLMEKNEVYRINAETI